MVDDLKDYGVYAPAVHYDFDVDEMSDSDDNVDEHQNHADHQNSNRANRVKIQQIVRGKAYMKHCLKEAQVSSRTIYVSRHTMQCIWDKAKKCHAQGRPVDVSSKKPKNCGPKRFLVDL
jgi:hypothetical protein